MKTSDSGRIFDIRRFSTHDGGGIRTTVFFKGCPLRCVWCHNPEGISPVPRPLWFSGACISCGSCEKAARSGGISQGESRIQIDPLAAEDWDAVMDACPTGALRWDSRTMHAVELMNEIRKDKPFYAYGGGGVTLSGGDPLMQADFAAEILRRCYAEGIHTAVETELYAKAEDVRRVLSYAQLIYADLKLFDSQKHKLYTGEGNGLILENLRMLLTGKMRDRVIVRTPMIPGITATEENIVEIAHFLTALDPDVRLELLNYNPLAAAKYPLMNKEYCFQKNPKRYTEEEMDYFRSIARRSGVKNILMD